MVLLSHALTAIASVLAGALLGKLVRRRRALPPATERQLARAARANRLEVRDPPRRYIPLPRDGFPDEEETR